MLRFKELIESLNKANDGTRTLFQSIAIPEVNKALGDYSKHVPSGVLIGGIAASYHNRPRATTDADILYMHKDNIPDEVPGFKHHRPGAFQHNDTHVEVEAVTPEHINISQELAQKVFDTAELSDRTNGIRVASPSGVVALKLHRQRGHDIGDIVHMHHTGKVDLSDWPIQQKHRDDYEEIIKKYS